VKDFYFDEANRETKWNIGNAGAVLEKQLMS
jgi:hypothetical protein